MAVNTRLCKACWKCVSICPRGVIGKIRFLFHRHIYILNPGNCIGCGACAKACPEGAIIVLKRPGGSAKERPV
nr:4Fe-4S binding protein [Desulfofarcimen acetoxidans]